MEEVTTFILEAPATITQKQTCDCTFGDIVSVLKDLFDDVFRHGSIISMMLFSTISAHLINVVRLSYENIFFTLHCGRDNNLNIRSTNT